MIGGARTIKIHGEYIPVEADVANLTMLSAHADSDELMRWLGSLQEPRAMSMSRMASRPAPGPGEACLGGSWACSVPALGSWGMLA
jgi:metallo-beta-lactamase family protein